MLSRRREGSAENIQYFKPHRLEAFMNDMESSVIVSWKEIARYFGSGVRTIQRWELDHGMPVHRPSGHLRGTVLAIKRELDAWASSCATRVPSCSHPIAQQQKLSDEVGHNRFNYTEKGEGSTRALVEARAKNPEPPARPWPA